MDPVASWVQSFPKASDNFQKVIDPAYESSNDGYDYQALFEGRSLDVTATRNTRLRISSKRSGELDIEYEDLQSFGPTKSETLERSGTVRRAQIPQGIDGLDFPSRQPKNGIDTLEPTNFPSYIPEIRARRVAIQDLAKKTHPPSYVQVKRILVSWQRDTIAARQRLSPEDYECMVLTEDKKGQSDSSINITWLYVDPRSAALYWA